MQMPPKSYFSTSWDDGHPSDMRLSCLLHKHSIRGTFYIPIKNKEGLSVLRGADIQSIGQQFEIGGHTLDHCYLDTVSEKEANYQIVAGKEALENILGEKIFGFCYPGGKHNQKIRELVKNAGFKYGRVVSNLDTEFISRFELPTTIQFYPHKKIVYIKNFLKNGSLSRYKLLPSLLLNSELKQQIISAMEYVKNNGGFFHIWGHSWEIEKTDGWSLLEDVLKEAKEIFEPDSFVTNGEYVYIKSLDMG